MDILTEVYKQSVTEDIKCLPSPMTPTDIYNYYNREKHVMGLNKAYKIARQIGHKLGGRIYINRVDFVRFLYKEEAKE